MLFNSISFLVFAALFFLFYFFIKHRGANFKWGFIVIASFVFYGWWDWKYIFLLFLTGLIDYAAALGIYRFPALRRWLLIVSLTSNLLVLFSFKYFFFFKSGLESMLRLAGLHFNVPGVPELFMVLPVGISFYTFQSMSYTIDVYRGKLVPVKNILHFFAFLSLFPQLVAGPIVRAADLLPQLKFTRTTSETERWHGLRLIVQGYFKKTVLADNIAPFVNSAFSNDLDNMSTPYWWIVMIGFALQIYFDFSGYTDIARGLAKWMGIHFRINFNHPYLAHSFKDFWSKWHISLSTWFRDYVFIPLGGSRRGKVRTYINLWITMLLSGLWHGAAVTFIMWGALHAFYLSIEKITKWPQVLHRMAIGRVLSILLVFILTTVAWVFFRAQSFSEALMIIERLFAFNNLDDWGISEVRFNGIFFISIGLLFEVLTYSSRFPIFKQRGIKSFAALEIARVGFLIVASIFLRGTSAQFIYFQF